MTNAQQDAPIVISMGDPAGIGPEIIGKAWEARDSSGLSPFFVAGSTDVFAKHWDGPVQTISDAAEANGAFKNALPVINIHDCDGKAPGEASETGAQCAFQALEYAVGMTRQGVVSAMVTAPVSKAQLYKVGFRHPGQTEFVAERCGVSRNNATMMLAAPKLRVIPMTTHIPLADVPAALTEQLIEDRIRAAHKGLIRNFGIQNPRIAIAGPNPHAGEDGNIGMEEIDHFLPVITRLRDEGLNITDPLSADTMFHAQAREQYDVALCAYHDQALIPIKTLYFDEAVNITLGLPIIRTSPDHGTAFNIAGQDKANPTSMIAAIKMASESAVHRKAYDSVHG